MYVYLCLHCERVINLAQVNLGQFHIGLSFSTASYALSAIGGGSATGRAVLGIFGDYFEQHRLALLVLSLWMNGLMAVLMASVSDVASFMVLSALFGLSAGAFISMVPLILEDYSSLPDLPRVRAPGLVSCHW